MQVSICAHTHKHIHAQLQQKFHKEYSPFCQSEFTDWITSSTKNCHMHL